jgi:hypothetical protein
MRIAAVIVMMNRARFVNFVPPNGVLAIARFLALRVAGK